MPPQTASECLRAAKALISRPENWGQGWFAFNKDGRDVEPDSPDAVRFCSLGALAHVDGPAGHTAAGFLNQVMYGDVLRFNDGHSTTHGMVLAKFDEAIKLAEKGGV